MQNSYQFRHLGHLHLQCQDDTDRTANQHADNDDPVDIDLWTQYGCQDGDDHAGDAVGITTA